MTKICPICLTEQDEFEKHHVVWKSEGGSNDPINLLKICKTCHAILTIGSMRDSIPRDMFCLSLKMSKYGLRFLLKSGLIFSEDSPFGKDYVTQNQGISAEIVDQQLKRFGTQAAEIYAEIIRGEIPHDSRWYDGNSTPLNSLRFED